jgi:hypothetical protein
MLSLLLEKGVDRDFLLFFGCARADFSQNGHFSKTKNAGILIDYLRRFFPPTTPILAQPFYLKTKAFYSILLFFCL